MATQAVASKGLTMDEMELLSNFSTTIKARQINAGVTVKKLVLSFTEVDGFSIELDEVPKEPVE